MILKSDQEMREFWQKVLPQLEQQAKLLGPHAELHSVGRLRNDPPGRIRCSFRTPGASDWDEPASPGYQLVSEIRERYGLTR